MTLSPSRIAEAFSRHDFTTAASHLADDVTWDNVGSEPIVGRQEVVAACQRSATYLTVVTTRFVRLDVIDAGETVVVESLAQYSGSGDDEPSVVASCDVYRFRDGLVVAIRSYNVEVEPGGGVAPEAGTGDDHA